MNFFILALLIFAIFMSAISVVRILTVIIGGRRWKGVWGFQLNVIYIVVFGALAFWLPQYL